MSTVIRRMTLDDVERVVAIDQASFSLPWPERSFRFELNGNTAARCWVAEVDGQLVGMVVVWLILDEAHIATLATHPEFRRHGVAAQLLVHALQAARAEGARSSFLEVRASNLAAQALYRKLGFIQSGLRRRYYKDNGEDALLMTLESLDHEVQQDH